MRQIKHSLLITCLWVLVFPAWSTEIQFQDHQSIENAVVSYVKARIQNKGTVETVINVNSLDSRLKLAHCKTPLEAFMPQNTRINSRFSVGVRCTSGKPWKLFIPVTVSSYTDIYVANHSLRKGDIIKKEDLRLVRSDINKLRTRPMTDAQQLIGMVVKRNISLGTPLSSRYLTYPTMINRGDTVDIIAGTDSIAIRMTGKALKSGAKGQRITVKNSSSQKVIDAIVVNAGTVKVLL